jgi:isoquinoline 1-oxidoreductase alpha subunit
MPKHSFILNGKRVNVECENDVRLLWVLRDILGVTGPKYGCGINVCKACTCHINGKAFNPCSVPVAKIKRKDEITTIEGLAATVGKDLHPMQAAWLEMDVAQCGYCQPGQIMSAVSKVNAVRRSEGRRTITDADIEEIRNVCRCGTYPRIREAIRAGAAEMPTPKKPKKKPSAESEKARKRHHDKVARRNEDHALHRAGAASAD